VKGAYQPKHPKMLLLALLENAGKFFKYRKGFRNAGKLSKAFPAFLKPFLHF
jgi:hypothetical protein